MNPPSTHLPQPSPLMSAPPGRPKVLTRPLGAANEVSLGRFISAAVASSALIVPAAMSLSTSPSPNHPLTLLWYRLLRKPAFTPPDIAVPIAWAAIETAMATAGYRLMRSPASPARTRALALLGWNVGMIGGWSRLFFGRRALGTSTLVAATMVATGAAYVQQARKVDRLAARAGVPFVAWVAFATVLTATIRQLNRR